MIIGPASQNLSCPVVPCSPFPMSDKEQSMILPQAVTLKLLSHLQSTINSTFCIIFWYYSLPDHLGWSTASWAMLLVLLVQNFWSQPVLATFSVQGFSLLLSFLSAHCSQAHLCGQVQDPRWHLSDKKFLGNFECLKWNKMHFWFSCSSETSFKI